MVKLALALIVKGSDEEAEALARCLSHTAPHVDGIFITITQPNQKVEEVANLYGATVSHFDWVNDFAAARNFNFSQVPKDFTHILWLDADDALRGASKLRGVLEKYPDVNVFYLPYLYDFDENKNPTIVHQKSQVVKNDNCVEWAGRLHEDFRPLKEIKAYHIKGIERLHLSNPQRYDQAKERNLEIAKEQVAAEPEDPRSYWNLGNALKSCGSNEEALTALARFLELSNSDDEKYLARLRRAECMWLLNRMQEAIEEARYAIGTRPEFPDAYHFLGTLFLELCRFEEAAEMYKSGLLRKPPVYKIIVYNPRDYDFMPLHNLAKCYYNLNLPTLALEALRACVKICPQDKGLKNTVRLMRNEAVDFEKVTKLCKRLSKITDKEKLQKELAKVPKKYQAHPGVCLIKNKNFIKETSSGKDLIFFCGFTQEEWTPETIKKKGIGGSEEAVYHLSQIFAENGWNVTVYNNCGPETRMFTKYGELIDDGAYTYIKLFDGGRDSLGGSGNLDRYNYVTYKPWWAWNYRDKQDVVILWRTPRFADVVNCDRVYVDLHDVFPAGEFTEERMKGVTKIFVKSKFQRDLYPNIADEKFIIVPNGISPEVFEAEIERDPYLIVNTSAPNRGIAVLTKMFKDIKAAVPEARLQWAYGFETFDNGFADNPKVMEWKKELQKEMKENGVEVLGRINHEEVAKLYQKANVWAYPSGFGEIDCISLSKAMAAGAIPVTTDFAALGEKQGHGGHFIHSDLTADTWVKPYQHDFSIVDPEQIKHCTEKIIEMLKNPPSEEERKAMREWAKETFSWSKVSQKWLDEFVA